MSTTIENAVVTGTSLGAEDHGIFTAYVYVEGRGFGCGFGGYALDKYNPDSNERRATAFGMDFIVQVLNTLDVTSWEKLKGTHCRVETEGWGGGILRIGHIIKDKWFDPKALAAIHFPDEGAA